MTTRAALIVNPQAGKGHGLSAATTAAAVLRGAGVITEIHIPANQAQTVDMSKAAVDSGTDAVIACGGDGTVHTVIQAVAQTPCAFGLIPTGTGDDNARTLGLPRHDPVASARVILDTLVSPRVIDLARATTSGSTGQDVSRWFIGVLSTGFDSSVNERANSMKWPKGHARYNLAILAELRTFRPIKYQVTIDDQLIEANGMLVSIGNGANYGGGMIVCPDAILDDGLLDLTWLHEISTARFLKVFPTVYKGAHVRNRAVQTFRGKHITVSARGQIAYADGERLGPLPVSIEVIPGALRVLAP